MKARFLLGSAIATSTLFSVFQLNAAPTVWTYPGCGTVTDTDFTYTTLVQAYKDPDQDLQEPDKMDFSMDAQGNVDIYFVEIRPGNIKRYSGATKKVKTLVKLPNWGNGSDYQTVHNQNQTEEGVTGIVLDPNFKTNHYIYVHWSPLPDTNQVFRISRFTVAGDTILMASEKVVLTIPGQRQTCCHTGGGMAFDGYGDLWISMGANSGRSGNNNSNPPEGINEDKKYESEEWGAASTYGLRGGIIRIHPDESPKGYTIPKDNFGEFFAKKTGDNSYLDTSKVSPEIFIKGCRNPYTLSIDPVRRWVMWGDVGPDVLSGDVREEDNLRKEPGFEGWPYFVGNNTSFSTPPGTSQTTTAPVNNSKWNKGLKVLPPARPTYHLHKFGSTPITGPLYRYDGDLNSTVKFPPHFDRHWFIADFSSNQVKVLTLSENGDTVKAESPIFSNHDFNGIVDFKAGPDGALYTVNYGNSNFTTGGNTRIEKISYKGTCRLAAPKLEQVTGSVIKTVSPYGQKGFLANIGKGAAFFVQTGTKGFEAFDLTGKKVWSRTGLKTGDALHLPANLPQGALQFHWVPN